MDSTAAKPLAPDAEGTVFTADPVPLEVQEAYRMYHEGYISSPEEYEAALYGVSA